MTNRQLQKRVRELELEVARLTGALEEARRTPDPQYVPWLPPSPPWYPQPWTITWYDAPPIFPATTTTCFPAWPENTYDPLHNGTQTTF